MNKIISISIFTIILTAACSTALPTAVTLPNNVSSPAMTDPIEAIPTPISPSPSLTPPVRNNLAVISSSNVSEVEKIIVLAGPTDKVTDLVFSADKAYLASTGYDEIIRLWDISTWQEVDSFPYPGADLNAIAFSPDGSLLASAHKIWNVRTKEIVLSLAEHQVSPAHVSFSPNGSQVVATANRSINVWDVTAKNEILSFELPADCRWLFSISFSPDGKLIAGACGNGLVYSWSAETGEITFTLEQGNEHDVHDIAFSPDGLILATGGTDQFARIWDVASGKELHKMPLIGMYSLALSPDGTLLATAGPDRTVKLWDVQTGRMLRSLHHADELMAVAFSADGCLIAAGGYDNKIVVWGIP